MQRFLILLAVCLCVVQSASARHITSSEAASAVTDFLRSDNAHTLGSAGDDVAVTLSYTAVASKSDRPAYYIFNRSNGEGFVIASADDNFRQILGYSDSGTFDINTAPDNMKWWLGEYRGMISAYYDAIDSIAADGLTTRTISLTQPDTRAAMPPVEPMVSSQWNQDAPFNDLCPEDADGRCMTGCVATAMAQIMYYNKWPQGAGTGSCSYNYNGLDVSCDFGSTVFDWNNMTDSYDANSNTAQCHAVAELMAACGASIHMQYTSHESGAYSYVVPWALVKYFGYDGDARYIERNGYSADEWDALVYSELQARRPVMYSGSSASGGHAFVCDGYQGDGYFHINWGWGGMADGYFLLSVLNPGSQGIGGYEGGYTMRQSIIAGIQPPVSDSKNRGFELFTDSPFDFISPGRFALPGNVYIQYPEAVNIAWAVEVVSDSDHDKAQIFKSDDELYLSACNIANGLYYPMSNQSISVNITGLEQGNYKVYPAYIRADGTTGRLRCPLSRPAYVSLSVDAAGNCTYHQGEAAVLPDISVTDLRYDSDLFTGGLVYFFDTVVNNSDYTYQGELYYEFTKDGETTYLTVSGYNVAPHSTYNGYFLWTVSLLPGVYDVIVRDYNGKQVNAKPFTVTVNDYIVVDGVNYTIESEMDMTAIAVGGKRDGDVIIHGSIEYNGLDYRVYRVIGRAFREADITSVVVEEGVEILEPYAFADCRNLKKVDLPSTLTNIYYDYDFLGIHAFVRCYNLAKINIAPANQVYQSVDNIIYSYDGRTLLMCPPGRPGTVTVKDGTVFINPQAFSDCQYIQAITLPESVLEIGSQAIYRTGISSLHIPAKVYKLGNGAIAENGNLNTLTVDDANPNFVAVDNVLFNTDKTELISAAAGKTGVYTVPASVSVIQEGAFAYSSLSHIEVGDNVVDIESSAFANARIESIRLPETISIIKLGVLMGCNSLKSLTLPDNIKEVKDFAAISALASCKTLYLGKKLSKLGWNSFYRTHPEAVDMNIISANPIPPYMENDNVFSDYDYEHSTLIVPESSIPAYRSAAGWCRFAHITAIETGVDNIQTPQISITATDGGIEVSGLDAGSHIVVYNASGQVVATRQATDGITTVTLPSGFYIVRAGLESRKITIR